MVSTRTDSDSRFGMQPNGPIAITPQEWDTISDMALPTVRIASPVRFGEKNGEPFAITALRSTGFESRSPDRDSVDLSFFSYWPIIFFLSMNSSFSFIDIS